MHGKYENMYSKCVCSLASGISCVKIAPMRIEHSAWLSKQLKQPRTLLYIYIYILLYIKI